MPTGRPDADCAARAFVHGVQSVAPALGVLRHSAPIQRVGGTVPDAALGATASCSPAGRDGSADGDGGDTGGGDDDGGAATDPLGGARAWHAFRWCPS